jgi:sugar phosphate isomerase/epimerase
MRRGGRAAEGERTVERWTFCTSTVLYGGQELERACAEIASLGLPAVDIWHVRGWCEHLAGGTQAVAATLRRHGLRLEAISAYNTPLEEVRRLLPVLAELGGHALVTGSAPPEVSVAEFAEAVRPLAREAATLGVRLAIENHGHATIDSLASMLELLGRVPEEGLGIALAPIHLWSRGESTAEAVRRLRGRIAFMYLWDWGPSAARNWKDPSEQLLGTGRIDFRPVAAALAEVGYGRPLCLFAHGPEHWPPERTTRELRAALERARALFASG